MKMKYMAILQDLNFKENWHLIRILYRKLKSLAIINITVI